MVLVFGHHRNYRNLAPAVFVLCAAFGTWPPRALGPLSHFCVDQHGLAWGCLLSLFLTTPVALFCAQLPTSRSSSTASRLPPAVRARIEHDCRRQCATASIHCGPIVGFSLLQGGSAVCTVPTAEWQLLPGPARRHSLVSRVTSAKASKVSWLVTTQSLTRVVFISKHSSSPWYVTCPEQLKRPWDRPLVIGGLLMDHD